MKVQENHKIHTSEFHVDKGLKVVFNALVIAISECGHIGSVENKRYQNSNEIFRICFKPMLISNNVRPIVLLIHLSEINKLKYTVVRLSLMYHLNAKSNITHMLNWFFGKRHLNQYITNYSHNFKRKVEVWM